MSCFTDGLRRHIIAASCLALPIYQPLVLLHDSPWPVTHPFGKPGCSFISLTALLQIAASRASVFQMAFQWRGVSSSLLAPNLEQYPIVCLNSSGRFTISAVSRAWQCIRPFPRSLMRYNLCWFNSSRIAICRFCFSWSPIPLPLLPLVVLAGAQVLAWSKDTHQQQKFHVRLTLCSGNWFLFYINCDSDSIWFFIIGYYVRNQIGALTDIPGPSAWWRGTLAPMFSK